MKRNSQRGVALVITLILLSVITFMAVTFLVVSRREAGQVDTVTQQARAKDATESALEHAKAMVIANMLTISNGYSFGLLVSTNFIQTNFDTTAGANYTNLLNVSYSNVTASGDYQQMLNNLLILPRAPVFIKTNANASYPLDFRYYLDLNRNGIDDPSGLFQVTNSDGTPAGTAPKYVSNFYVGDPEWIGVLNHPDMRHSSSNQFVSRYCFFALPIGNSLDINYIHNAAKQGGSSGPFLDGFLRDQGVGSWEINLAAFLNTISPTNWDYLYKPVVSPNNFTISPSPSTGYAFDDSASILRYRYNNSMANLQSVNAMFGVNGVAGLGLDFIDDYLVDPLQSGLTALTNNTDSSYVNSGPWSGADNPNQFFTPGDFFNKPINISGTPANSFSNRLYQAGFSRGTDERYTFYRMLAQLSFGSSPEAAPAPSTPRMNLNYINVTNGATATNFIPWGTNAVMFFTNAADRMLRHTFPNPILTVLSPGVTNTNYISITNIQLYPTNYYTPAVHRLLQLAANMYDATTNRLFDAGVGYFPSVFRPTFNRGANNIVYVSGYVEDQSTGAGVNAYNIPPLTLPDDAALVNPLTTTNIYGIPWIVGVKKGLPNFNEFSMASVSQITRKVQLVRTNGTILTNVQYTVGISNAVGFEAWNSYAASYPRAVTITAFENFGATMTNELGAFITITNPASPPGTISIIGGITNMVGAWAGFNSGAKNALVNANSFQIPLMTNVIFLSDQVYHPFSSQYFSTNQSFDMGPQWYLPHFKLNMTNRMRFVMTDTATGRVIDYVHFATNVFRDLTAELPGDPTADHGGVWSTNATSTASNSLTSGIYNQIQVAQGTWNIPNYGTFTVADWQNDQVQPGSVSAGETQMSQFFGGSTNSVQVPFTPTRKIALYFTWQANDPLVHYTTGDLTVTPPSVVANPYTNYIVPPLLTTNPLINIGIVNDRYYPWGDQTGAARKGTIGDSNAYNIAVKDPGMINPDAWQFPTNKFPNLGWLGRVHRGTPWQTVYLKSTPVASNSVWTQWSGDTYTNYTGTNDSILTQPTNDWALMDLFTTSPNDNASRGQLSINQSGAASWAAVLAGVITVTNTTNGFQPLIIEANTNVSTNIQYLTDSINAYRANTNFNPSGTFTSIGQICGVPQLTVASPYLDLTVNTNALTDALYERIPQQIMSLLRLGSPRYAIFAYGQSLKPAPNSIATSGAQFGMCTNYQITGEMATRTIVRFDGFPGPGQSTAPKAVVESYNVLAPE